MEKTKQTIEYFIIFKKKDFITRVSASNYRYRIFRTNDFGVLGSSLKLCHLD